MRIFDHNGRMKERVWVVSRYKDGECSVDTFINGKYDGSYVKMRWLEFPPEVAVVFI